MIGIYKIANNINNNVYIGQSIDIMNRWKQHIGMLENKIHHSSKLQKFYNENPDVKFNFEILEICKVNELNFYENKFVQEYDSLNNGFNVASCGNTNSQKPKIKQTKSYKENDKPDIITLYHADTNGNIETLVDKNILMVFNNIINACDGIFEFFIHGEMVDKIDSDYELRILENISYAYDLFEDCTDFMSVCIDTTNPNDIKSYLCINLTFTDYIKCEEVDIFKRFNINKDCDMHDFYTDVFNEYHAISKINRFKFYGGRPKLKYMFYNGKDYGDENE